MFTRRAAGRALVAVTMMCTVVAVAAQPAYAIGTVSVGDVAVVEGTGGSTTLSFVVSLSTINALPVTVDYVTSNGSASAGSDYTAASGQASIPAGATSTTIPIAITTDALAEPNEAFTLTLSNPSLGTSIGDGSATGTITNDDGAPPSLSVNDPTINETDAPGTVNFTVSLQGPAVQTVTVGYTTAAGTAASGDDFGATTGTATILAGETSTVVPVAIVGDDLDESDETFTLTLSNPTNASIADASGSATIVDDDVAPTVQSDSPSVAETDDATSLVFTVTLSSASGRTATVDFATSNGTATAGADYTATSGTLIFVAGDISETVTVPVIGDDLDEPDETVELTLSSPDNAVLTQATATGTIIDDEAAPALSIADLSFSEGDEGSTSAQVTVTLSAPSGQPVTVNAATGTGTATVGTDYQAAATGLTFPAGVTTRTVTVSVLGDLLDEADETVPVTLSEPVGAIIADGSATLTITDDDATPSLSLSDTDVVEGNAGTTPVMLTLTLSAPSGRDVSVAVSTSSGTATAGVDFAAQAGTVIQIAAGSTTTQVSASVFGDTVDEADEAFTLNLSGATNASIADSAGTITILDDDNGPSLSIDDVAMLEGSPPPSTDTAFTFTVTLSGASEQTVTTQYSTSNSSATAGPTGDYDASSGTVTFTPGQTSMPVTVNVNRDLHAEPAEAFLVTLSAPSNAVLSLDATGIGTINNDDGPAASLSIADVVVAESAGDATLTVTLSGPATQDVSVDVTTSNGAATAPADYGAIATTVSIATGQISGTTVVAIVDDPIDEPSEAFTATLSNAHNAALGDGTATVIITDNDDPPSLSVADASVTEGSSGSVTVTLSAPSSQTITVQATTTDGTASSADYTTVATTVTFAAGETTKQVSVPTLEDTLDEADETVTITLSAPTGGATIADGTGVLTITDNDARTLSVADANVEEGSSGSLTVTLSAASTQTITVQATTTNGTATNADYTSVATAVTFAPGQTSKQVAVPTLEDALDEAAETVTITLSAPTAGATIADGTGVLTITDNDAPSEPAPPAPKLSRLQAITGEFTPVVGDFRGVGREDILWFSPGGADLMWRSTGDGGFTTESISVTGSFTPIVGDFDGDGHDDIYWFSPTGGDALYRGTATGFSATYPNANGDFSAHVGDYNGDGYDDIYWFSTYGGDAIYYGHATGFTAIYPNANGALTAHTGDFNGDGRDDIYWFSPTDGDAIYYGQPSGFTATYPNANGDFKVLVGDYDGDGIDDLYWFSPGGGDALYYGNAGGFTAIYPNANGSFVPVVTNLDTTPGDDIVWYAPGTSGDAYWRSTGNRGAPFTGGTVTINGFYRPIAGQFDDTPGNDILWYDPTSGPDALWYG